jgi:hypothetical protein
MWEKFIEHINTFLLNHPYLWDVFLVVTPLFLAAFVKTAYKKYKHKRLKAVFGRDLFLSDSLHLVYAKFSLPPVFKKDGSINTHPYVKPDIPGMGFSMENPVSSCEVRASKYLSQMMGKEVGHNPILASDIDLKMQLNISFVTFGGPGNYKSNDLLTNESNNFLTFNSTFITCNTNRPVLYRHSGFDYGLIQKIHPIEFPERTWLICAGFDEWGSSGAAWYLAYKWREIYKFAKSKAFAIVVKVKHGQDESAYPIIKIKSVDDAERYASKLK